MVRYIPIKKIINAVQLADIFYKEVIYRYGMPYGIVSDRRPVFISAF